MAGRTIGAEHEERSLAAVRLNATGEDGGVFRAAEVHRILTGGHAFDVADGFRENLDEFGVVGEVDGLAHLLDGVLAVLAQSAALDDVDGGIVHVLVDFAGFTADFHLHDGVRRDHVAAFAGNELAHVDAGHAAAVAGDAEQLHEGVAGGGHGVVAGVGFDAGVSRTARVGDVELRRAEEAVGVDGDFAGLAHHGDVGAEEVVGVVKDAGGGHAGGAADAFLSRLEEDLDLAVHLVDVVGEPVGDGQAGGGVGVVAAGVHQARTLGDEAFASGDVAVFGGFRDGDAVDVEADGERGAGTPRVHHADAAREAVHFGEELFAHAVLAGELEAGFNNLEVAAEAVVGIDDFLAEQHFVAVFTQLADDEGGRGEFAPAFLRHRVKMAADFDQLVMVGAGAGHWTSPQFP